MVRVYSYTFAALLVLTTLTFALSFAALGSWHIPVAVLIAIAKTVLIALFFMHLREQSASNALAIIAAVLLLAVFVGLSALDVATRILPGT